MQYRNHNLLIIAFNSCVSRPAVEDDLHQFQLLHHLNVRVRHASEAICEGGTVLLACPGSRVDVSLCACVLWGYVLFFNESGVVF